MKPNIILLFCTFIIPSNCERKFEITMRRVDCTDIDTDHILNLTCRVKAARGRKGILNLYWIFKDVDDYFVSEPF